MDATEGAASALLPAAAVTQIPASVLGGMSAAVFLRDYWQKRPLLIRQAVPGFGGIIDRDDFLALATREDATSRLVIQHPQLRKGRWERHDGPFAGIDASMLPSSHWTMLIHGLESLIPGGWELLRAFSFVPWARVDDLMVSYAAEGGTVGPHDDDYDVFLLQGPGKRRWQVSHQTDRTLDPDAAIKVLKHFECEAEWLLEPGDMLYLPPGVAHWGVAETPCFTYSIGFLAPSHRELMQNYLGYLGDVLSAELSPSLRYSDPDLHLQKDPLRIGDAMVEKVSQVLQGIAFQKATVGEFLGRYLTAKKPASAFCGPRRPLALPLFAKRLQQPGHLQLALPSRGLVRGKQLFLNGEAHSSTPQGLKLFSALCQDRSVPLPQPLDKLDEPTLALLHGFYTAGYLHLA